MRSKIVVIGRKRLLREVERSYDSKGTLFADFRYSFKEQQFARL